MWKLAMGLVVAGGGLLAAHLFTSSTAAKEEEEQEENTVEEEEGKTAEEEQEQTSDDENVNGDDEEQEQTVEAEEGQTSEEEQEQSENVNGDDEEQEQTVEEEEGQTAEEEHDENVPGDDENSETILHFVKLLGMAKEEIERLKLESQANKDHMTQYKNIAQVNEAALKQMEVSFEIYRNEAENRKNLLEEEISSLRDRVLQLVNEFSLRSDKAFCVATEWKDAIESLLLEISNFKDESSTEIRREFRFNSFQEAEKYACLWRLPKWPNSDGDVLGTRLNVLGSPGEIPSSALGTRSQIASMEVQINSLQENLQAEQQKGLTIQKNYQRQVLRNKVLVETLRKEINSGKEEKENLQKRISEMLEKSKNIDAEEYIKMKSDYEEMKVLLTVLLKEKECLTKEKELLITEKEDKAKEIEWLLKLVEENKQDNKPTGYVDSRIKTLEIVIKREREEKRKERERGRPLKKQSWKM